MGCGLSPGHWYVLASLTMLVMGQGSLPNPGPSTLEDPCIAATCLTGTVCIYPPCFEPSCTPTTQCVQSTNLCMSNNICHNGGSCIPGGVGQATCLCPPGYSGKYCHIRLLISTRQACDGTNPCLNGGTCVNQENNSSRCQCPINYAGERCEQTLVLANISVCTSTLCLEGELCIPVMEPCNGADCTVKPYCAPLHRGNCPYNDPYPALQALLSGTGTCRYDCLLDIGCGTNQKCCMSGCSAQCVAAVDRDASPCNQKKSALEDLRSTYFSLMRMTTVTYGQLLTALQQVYNGSSLLGGLLPNVGQGVLGDLSSKTVGEVVEMITNTSALPAYNCTASGAYEALQCNSYLNGTQGQCYCANVFTGAPRAILFSPISSCDRIIPGEGCPSLPCQNGGTCSQVGLNAVICTCPPGYSGLRCEINIQENLCLFQNCGPGYTCVVENLCTGTDCIRVPRCVSIVTGTCPPPNITAMVLDIAEGRYTCSEECKTDTVCTDGRKCCYDGPCQSSCVTPQQGLSTCRNQQQTYNSLYSGMASLSTVTHVTYRDYITGLKSVPNSQALFRFDPAVEDLLLDLPLGEVVSKAYELEIAITDIQCNSEGDYKPKQCRLNLDGTTRSCYCIDVTSGLRSTEDIPAPGELTCTGEKPGVCQPVSVNPGVTCPSGPACTSDPDCDDLEKCCVTECGERRCLPPADPCSGSICQNFGTCQYHPDIVGQVYCLCREGFSGKFCEIKDPTPCDNNPCYSGGTCVVRQNLASCLCPFPSYGRFCEKTFLTSDPCDSLTCATGDVCLVQCTGPSGNCQAEARCYDSTNVTTYMCPSDMSSIYCTIGANCYTDEYSTHRCVCKPGFSGDNCQNSAQRSGLCPAVNMTDIIIGDLTDAACPSSCMFDGECPGTSKCCGYSQRCGRTCQTPVSDLMLCELQRLNATEMNNAISYLRTATAVTVSDFFGRVETNIVRSLKQYFKRVGMSEADFQKVIKLLGDQTVRQLMDSVGATVQTLTPSCTTDGRFAEIQCYTLNNGQEGLCDCVNVLTGESWGTPGVRSALNCTEKPGLCSVPEAGLCAELCTGDSECPGREKCCSTVCGHACQSPRELGCASNPCMNDGLCTPLGTDRYVCVCNSGFEGTFCEQFVGTRCSREPGICKNGGYCEPLGNERYRCQCTFGYSGTNCEYHDTTSTTTIRPPNPEPLVCKNVVCPDQKYCIAQEECRVMNGFKDCRSRAVCRLNDNCLSYPCMNGGSCYSSDLADGYGCSCPTGFTGKNCQRFDSTPGVCPEVNEVSVLNRLVQSPLSLSINCMTDSDCGGGGTKCCPTDMGSSCVRPLLVTGSLCQQQNRTLMMAKKSLYRLSQVENITFGQLSVYLQDHRVQRYFIQIIQVNISALKTQLASLQGLSIGAVVNASMPLLALPFPNCTRNSLYFEEVQCLKYLNGTIQVCYCADKNTGEMVRDQMSYPPWRPVCSLPDRDGCRRIDPYICGNGGSCRPNEIGGYWCMCWGDYYGPHCEYRNVTVTPTPSPTHPVCQNVVCPDQKYCIAQEECRVMNGFKDCRSKAVCRLNDNCLSYPCMNGGSCYSSDRADGYGCSCPTGFTGKNCQRFDSTPGVCPEVNEVSVLNRLVQSPLSLSINCMKDSDCVNGTKCCPTDMGSSCVRPLLVTGSLCQQQNRTLMMAKKSLYRLSQVENITFGQLSVYLQDHRVQRYFIQIIQVNISALQTQLASLQGLSIGAVVNASMPLLALPFPNCTRNSLYFEEVQCLKYLNGTIQVCYCADKNTGEMVRDQMSYPPWRPVCSLPDRDGCRRIDPYICGNGGSCRPNDIGGYWCMCWGDYYGPHCEYRNVTVTPTPSPTHPVCQNVFCPDQKYCIAQEECRVMNGFKDCRSKAVCRLNDNCLSYPCMNGGSCYSSDLADGYGCRCPTGFTGKTCQRIDSTPGVCPEVNEVSLLNRLVQSPLSLSINCMTDSDCGGGDTKCCPTDMGSSCVRPLLVTGSLCQQQNRTLMMAKKSLYRLSQVENITFGQLSVYLQDHRVQRYFVQTFQVNISALQTQLASLQGLSIGAVVNASMPLLALPFPNCARNSLYFEEVQCLKYLNGTIQVCYCADKYTGEMVRDQMSYPPWRPVCSLPDRNGCNRIDPYICGNGGSCRPNDIGGYWCMCWGDYYGPHCEYRHGTVTPKPSPTPSPTPLVCQSFTCPMNMYCAAEKECRNPQDCRTNPVCKYSDSCMSNPCMSGGSCYKSDKRDGYSCSCPTGFTGKNCQRIDSTPGVCPEVNEVSVLNRLVQSTLSLSINCMTDSDCGGGTKCCPTDMGSSCVRPLLVTGSLCQQQNRTLMMAKKSLYRLSQVENITFGQLTAYLLDPRVQRFFMQIFQVNIAALQAELASLQGLSIGAVVNASMPLLALPFPNCTRNSLYFEEVQCLKYLNGTIQLCYCADKYMGEMVGSQMSYPPWKPVCSSQDRNTCFTNPYICGNGGSCRPTDNGRGYWCMCWSGYYGPHCEYHNTTVTPTPSPTPSVCQNFHCGGNTYCVEQRECRMVNGYHECRTKAVCKAYDVCGSMPCMNAGSCFPDNKGDYYCVCQTDFTGKNCQRMHSTHGVCPEINEVSVLNRLVQSPLSLSINCMKDSDCWNDTKCCPTDMGSSCVRPLLVTGSLCQQQNRTLMMAKKSLYRLSQVENITFDQLSVYLQDHRVQRYFVQTFQVNISALQTQLASLQGLSIGAVVNASMPLLALPFPNCTRNSLYFEEVQCLKYLNGTIQVCYCADRNTGEMKGRQLSYYPWRPVCSVPDRNVCFTNPYICGNGGSCRPADNGRGYWCMCWSGYYGPHCEYHNTTVTPTPSPTPPVCQNIHCGSKAYCVAQRECRMVNGYHECRTYGVCKAYDVCGSMPCMNSGSCFPDNKGDYYCVCQTDFTGKNCQRMYSTPGVCPEVNEVSVLNRLVQSPLSLSINCMKDSDCGRGTKCCPTDMGSSCVRPLLVTGSLCQQQNRTLMMAKKSLYRLSQVENITFGQLSVYLQDHRVQRYFVQTFQVNISALQTQLASLQSLSIGAVVNASMPLLALPFPNCTRNSLYFEEVQCLKYLNGTIQVCYCADKYTGEMKGRQLSYYPWRPVCYEPEPPSVCSSHPCLNGGSCRRYGNSYRCDCACGYYGYHCERQGGSGPSLCWSKNCPSGTRCVVEQQCRRRSAGVEDCEANAVCKVRESCSSYPCMFGGTCVQDSAEGYTCQCRPGFKGSTCGLLDSAPGVCPSVDSLKWFNRLVSSTPGFSLNCFVDSNCTRGEKCCATENGVACVPALATDASMCEQQRLTAQMMNATFANLSRVTNITYRQIASFAQDSRVLGFMAQMFMLNLSAPMDLPDSIQDMTIGQLLQQTAGLVALPFPKCANGSQHYEAVQCLKYLNGSLQTCYCADMDTGEMIGSQISVWPWTPVCPRQDLCGRMMGDCFNGGSCLRSGSGYRCECACGYYGPHCEHRSDGVPPTPTPTPRYPCENFPCPAGERCATYSSCQQGFGCRDIPYCTRDPDCTGDTCVEMTCPQIPLSDVAGIIQSVLSDSGSCNSECSSDDQCASGASQRKCCTVGCRSVCTAEVQRTQSECQHKNYTMTIVLEAVKVLRAYGTLTISEIVSASMNLTIVEEIADYLWPGFDVNNILAQYGRYPVYVALQMLEEQITFQTSQCNEGGRFSPVQCEAKLNGTTRDCFCVNYKGNERPGSRYLPPGRTCADFTCTSVTCPSPDQYCTPTDMYGGYTCAGGVTTTVSPGDRCAQLTCQNGGSCEDNPTLGLRCVCPIGLGGTLCEKPVTKLGLCPAVNIIKLTQDYFDSNWMCEQQCTNDWQCSGAQKCCMDGCIGRCVEPIRTDLSNCEQEKLVQEGSLKVIAGLSNVTGATVGSIIRGTQNNSHALSFVASVVGVSALDNYYGAFGNVTFQFLGGTYLSYMTTVPLISCLPNGQYNPQQCVGSLDGNRTSSCYCVTQQGWEVYTSRIFDTGTGGPIDISCESAISTIQGEVTLTQACSADLQNLQSASFKRFELTFMDEMRRIFLSSDLNQFFGGIRISSIQCESPAAPFAGPLTGNVVEFEVDLQNIVFGPVNYGVPRFLPVVNRWEITLELIQSRVRNSQFGMNIGVLLSSVQFSAGNQSVCQSLDFSCGPCNSGYVIDERGCPICRCIDPCEKVVCSPGYRCGMRPDRVYTCIAVGTTCPQIPLSDVTGIIQTALSFNGSCSSECSGDNQCVSPRKCCTVGCRSLCTEPVQTNQSECQLKNYTMSLVLKSVMALRPYGSVRLARVFNAAANITLLEELGRFFLPEFDSNAIISSLGNLEMSTVLQRFDARYKFPTSRCNKDGSFAPRQCDIRANGTTGDCFCVDSQGNERPNSRALPIGSTCADFSCFSVVCPTPQYCEPTDMYGGYRCAGGITPSPTTTVTPTDPCLQLPCQNGGRCEFNPTVGLRCVCPFGLAGTFCERPVMKLGLCPAVNVTKLTQDYYANKWMCAQQCTNDWQCSGAQKCCLDGCTGRCVEPIMTDLSSCEQEKALQEQSLNLITDLSSLTGASLGHILRGTQNNSHVWSLVASVSGISALDFYYSTLMQFTFARLKATIQSFLTTVPFFTCLPNGQYNPRQCLGNLDQNLTSSCYCVTPQGFEIYTSRVFPTSGSVDLTCESVTSTIQGEVTLNQSCSSDLQNSESATYKRFEQGFLAEMRRIFLSSDLVQIYAGARITSIQCNQQAENVVLFEVDLQNIVFGSINFGIPRFDPRRNRWDVTIELIQSRVRNPQYAVNFGVVLSSVQFSAVNQSVCEPLDANCGPCSFGYVYDEQGCPICRCYDPCGGCPDGYSCGMRPGTAEYTCLADPLVCGPGEIKCIEFGKTNEICVPVDFICDDDPDCDDRSDEANCTATNVCEEGSSRCANGEKCVLNTRFCDLINDCEDGSDERGCPATTTTKPVCPSISDCTLTCQHGFSRDSRNCEICQCFDPCAGCPDGYSCGMRPNTTEYTCLADPLVCGPGEIKCIEFGKTNEICVPVDFICDDDPDCDDRSDEANCTATNVCEEGSRRCADGEKCVLNTRFCDLINDCTDGSDERGCPSTTTPTTQQPDVNECTTGTHGCHPSGTCTNTQGSYICECNPGFSGNGFTCIDVNECSTGSHGCHSSATCTNTQGSYICQCNSGFSGDGFTCIDVNECAIGSHGCHSSATCTNTQGSYICQCNSGFSGDGFTCIDVNECAISSHGCHSSATCTNTQGSYICQCNSGFSGDGFTCIDVDECSAPATNACSANADCTNTVGTYVCTCRDGFNGNGRTCLDIIECTDGTSNCSANADCTNQVGTFVCTCRDGFYGDGSTCSACNCNVMGSSSSVCDVVSGDCLCKTNVAGRTCDQCTAGSYGFGPNGCSVCGCDPTGSSSTVCDVSGNCSCKTNVNGRTCDRCAAGSYNFGSNGCTACGCDQTGSLSAVCNAGTGVCSCKANVMGRTCDQCAAGSYGFGSNGCTACGCNAMGSSSTVCDVVTGVCLCKTNVNGRTCDQCTAGSYNFGSNGCSACGCDQTGSSSAVCNAGTGVCSCKTNVIGRTCNQCAVGSYGFGSNGCTACNCNVMGSSSTVCDVVTGVCSCKTNVNGRTCDQCAAGSYNFGSNGCTACGCDQTGSLSAECNAGTGVCSCKTNVIGRTCDQCAAGSYNFGSNGCTSCNCNAMGSSSTVCDVVSGDCSCKTNVAGRTCDQCTAGSYNFGPNGCTACGCDQTGSLSAECNAGTGVCSCKTNVIGRTCNQCAAGSYNFGSNGCTSCNCDGSGAVNNNCDVNSGQCLCRPNVIGRTCGACQPGFWQFPQCHRCECNGNADTCDESGRCIDCRGSTTGDSCESCLPGYVGDATQQNCLPRTSVGMVIPVNQNWTDDLNNKSSVRYQELEDWITSQVMEALKNSSLSEFFIGFEVISMEPGSIRINVRIFFGNPGVAIIEEGATPPENATTVITVAQLRQVLREQQRTSNFLAGINVDDIEFEGVVMAPPPVCSDLSNCSLSCPYGMMRNDKNCEICECWEPCQCSSTEVCVVNYRDRTGECQTEKPGFCPRSESIGSSCSHECRYDAACPSSQKCCSGLCGTFCVDTLAMKPRNLTECEERLSEVADRLTHFPRAQVSLPRCELGSGAWSPVQHHDSLGISFCVDSAGNKIAGSEGRGTPDCAAAHDASQNISICPAEGSLVHSCDPALCIRNHCIANSQATCRINPCGACIAEFFDTTNTKVDCNRVQTTCQSRRRQLMQNALPSTWGSSIREIQKRTYKHLMQQEKFMVQPSGMLATMNGRGYATDFCQWKVERGTAGNMRWYFDSDASVCTQTPWSGPNNVNLFPSRAECERQCSDSLFNAPYFKGAVVPQCGDTGLYTNKQCHDGYCWCISSEGILVPGSLTRGNLTCNDNGIAFISNAPVCPNGSPASICDEHCANARCTGNPHATCYADPCNNCSVTFATPEGIVDCTDTPVCELPMDAGSCSLKDNRWFYNSAADKCQPFVFGGCNGNANNFPTRGACEDRCYKLLPSRPVCVNRTEPPSLCWKSCWDQTCEFFPEAVCKEDPCDSCKVKFYSPDTDFEVDCNRLNTKCQRERARKRSLGTPPAHIPQCDEKDGEFEPKQCDQTECWCVDGEGDPAASVRVILAERDYLNCEPNKTVEGKVSFKLEIDFGVVEGKEADFINAVQAALQLLLSGGFDVKEIKISRGSIIIDLILLDTNDTDLSEALNIIESKVVQSQFMIIFENMTMIVDPDSLTIIRTFALPPAGNETSTPMTSDETSTTPGPAITQPPDKQDFNWAIGIAAACGAALLVAIIGISVVHYRKQKEKKEREVDFSESGEGALNYIGKRRENSIQSGIPVDNALYFSNPTGLPADEYAQPELGTNMIYPSLGESSKKN